MRRCPALVALILASSALLGCSSTPTGPDPAGLTEFDPTPLFSRLAGGYTLTFEPEASCTLPAALNAVTYDVSLQQSPYRYLAVRVTDELFAADLWARATEAQGLWLRWNVDCDEPDAVGALSFILCGEGPATVEDGTIAGRLETSNAYRDADARPMCSDGARFVFRRK